MALMVVAPRLMNKLGRPTVAPDIVARRFKAYLAEAATAAAGARVAERFAS